MTVPADTERAEPLAAPDPAAGLGRYLSGAHILQIDHHPRADDAPVVPGAVVIGPGFPGYDGRALKLADGTQDAVFVHRTLESLAEYRQAIAEWFRVLRLGGHLVITVPHQFMFERKLSPPSRWDKDHKRFYTAASLLAEIEDSLDPMSYRVRLLEERDEGFDDQIPVSRPAVGRCDVVVVIERIARAAYADAVMDRTIAGPGGGGFLEVHKADAPELLRIIESDQRDVRRILVIKLDHRGDFILAKPAFAALRAQFADAHITLLCGPWNRDAALELGLFDDIATAAFFPEVASHGHEKLSDAEKRTALEAAHLRVERALAGRSWDIAIDFRVDRDTRPLLADVDAAYRAGFGATEDFPFLDIALPFINPTAAGRTFRRVLKADQFSTHIGTHEGFAIVHTGGLRQYKPGFGLIYGPYATFEAGRWDLEMIIEPLKERFDIAYDVCASSGDDILAYGSLTVGGDAHPRFGVQFDATTDGVEIRLWTRMTGRVPPFRFMGVRAVKYGSFSALHQQEMQALLVHLVALRMRNPFVTTVRPA